jgi:hypothetical protein
MKGGQLEEAIKVMYAMKGMLPISTRLHLWFIRFYYHYAVILYFCVTLLIAALLLVSWFVWLQLSDPRKMRVFLHRFGLSQYFGYIKPEDSDLDDQDLLDDRDVPMFVRGKRGTKMNPILHEYCQCIKVLELKPGASIKEIKKAYRRLLKAYHPDAQGSSVHSDKFMAVGKAYDRLMEIETEELVSTSEKRSMFFEV